MTELSSRRNTIAAAFAVFLISAPLTPLASAQDRPAAAAELAAGTLLFADDSVVREGFVGGAVRFFVLPRISVGPEIAYIQGDNHSHLMLTGNLTFDFLRRVNDRARRVTPFAVVGGGLFRTRETFRNEQTFTSSDGAFTAGGGVRALLSDAVTAGFEARVGWELHVRLNAFVGVRLGRR